MPDYEVFGGVLRSNLTFPSLPLKVGAEPTHRLVIAQDEPPSVPMEELGTDRFEGGAIVRAYRFDSSYRIVYDGLGTFDVLDQGRSFRVYPQVDADPEHIRLCVIGRVFALALHAAGYLCLHGSAAVLGNVGVAFLAPSGSGKSTLLMALKESGAEILADDSIPVEPGPPVRVHPGVASVRLRSDSSSRFRSDTGERSESYKKVVVRDLARHSFRRVAAPLAAVYLLQRVEALPGDESLERVRIAPHAAAFELVRNGRMGSLLNGEDAIRVLSAAAIVARQVPVYFLRLVHDYSRLPTVVSELRSWHSDLSSLGANITPR